MPRRRASSPDQITQDFLDAIDRLKIGRPQHPELRARVRSGKLPKINIVTVAKEAGHSRGLIATEDCRYPLVRQIVLMEAGAVEILPKTRDDVIKKLRLDIAELRVALAQAEAHAAYHFDQRTKAEKARNDYKARYERLKARIDTGSVRQQSTVVSLFPDDRGRPA